MLGYVTVRNLCIDYYSRSENQSVKRNVLIDVWEWTDFVP